MTQESWKIIDAVAAALGVKEAARLKWRSRGVAHRWRYPILAEALKRGTPLTYADLDALCVESADVQ